jgi:hypothetical protein
MFQTKVEEKIKTYISPSITFLENRAAYEILWKHIAEQDRPQMAVWHMRIACWVTKATNTHTHTHAQYAILIADPLLQWLHESTSELRYTYIACLVNTYRHSSVYINSN